jgi:hypothetical protein
MGRRRDIPLAAINCRIELRSDIRTAAPVVRSFREQRYCESILSESRSTPARQIGGGEVWARNAAEAVHPLYPDAEWLSSPSSARFDARAGGRTSSGIRLPAFGAVVGDQRRLSATILRASALS